MEGDVEAEVIPVDLQRDWYFIFICSDSTGLFFKMLLLNDLLAKFSLCVVFSPTIYEVWVQDAAATQPF